MLWPRISPFARAGQLLRAAGAAVSLEESTVSSSNSSRSRFTTLAGPAGNHAWMQGSTPQEDGTSSSSSSGSRSCEPVLMQAKKLPPDSLSSSSSCSSPFEHHSYWLASIRGLNQRGLLYQAQQQQQQRQPWWRQQGLMDATAHAGTSSRWISSNISSTSGTRFVSGSKSSKNTSSSSSSRISKGKSRGRNNSSSKGLIRPELTQQEVQGAFSEQQSGRKLAPKALDSPDDSFEVQLAAARRFGDWKLQAAAVAEVEALLPAGSLQRLPYGCKADLGFTTGHSGLYLGLKVKAGTVQPGGNVVFKGRTAMSTGTVVCICRPRPSYKGALILAEHQVLPGGIKVMLKESSKWFPYLVPDGQLLGVLAGIYQAVQDRKASFALPSGHALDTSSLQLVPLNWLSTPSAKIHRKTEKFFLLRQQWFPALKVQRRIVNGMPLGAVIEGVHVQNKVATRQHGMTQGMVVYMNIEPGATEASPSFELLWVFHPDNRHFWLVPAEVLAAKGCLVWNPAIFRNSKTLIFYDHSYQKGCSGRHADTWTQAYCLDSQDPDCEQKVRALLQAAKAGRTV